MSVSGNMALVIRMLLDPGQYKAELAQAVTDTQAAASKIEGSTTGITDAVQAAVQGQSAAVRVAASALAGLGVMAGAAVAAAAAVGMAYHEAGKETLAYEKAIILTGNAAGVTSGQLADMARSMDGVVGTQANAAAALASMTASGQVARENLEKVSLAAVEMERATGQSIGETTKIFASLGDAPVKASLRLNESMNYLTAGTYAQIKAAEELGDKEAAASIAQNAAADALRERAAGVQKHLGYVERAWKAAGDMAKWAWDRFVDIGRAQTADQQLQALQKKIAEKENQLATTGFGENAGGAAFGRPSTAAQDRLKSDIASLGAQAAALQGVAYAAGEAAKAQAAKAAVEKAGIEAINELSKANDRAMTGQEKASKALKDYRDNVKAARAAFEQNPTKELAAFLDTDAIKKAEAAIIKSGQSQVKTSGAVQKEHEREAALLATLSGVNADYQTQLVRLQKARAAGNVSEERYIELVEALIAKQPMAKRLMDEQTKATTAAEKATQELAKARDKALVTQGKELEKAQAALLIQQEQNARLGLTKEAIAELDAAKLEMLATDLELQAIKQLDKNLDEQQYQSLMAQAQAWRELASAKRDGAAKQAGLEMAKESEKAAAKASDDWQKSAESIERTLTDGLMRGFESGKGFAKNLRDMTVNMFKTMVLRPVISAVMSPVSGAISGAMGLSGGAQAASGGASGLGMLGNAASLFGAGGIGGSVAAGAGWLTGATTLGGSLSAGASLIGTGTLAGGASGLGMIAGALGPIALGIGAVMALVKKLDDSGTMHTGALSQYSTAGGLANSTTHGAFGMGFGGVDYSAETEKFTGAMAQSIVLMLDSTATTFGKDAGYKAATAFADDTSKDGAWGGLLISKLEETIVNWDPARTSKWAPREFADGAAGKEQYLAAVAADVRTALESIGLPAWATGMLDKLGQGASIEQLAGAVDQINAAKAAFAGFAQYMPTFAGLADSALGKLVEASGGAAALAGNMSAFVDGFYTDAEKFEVNASNVAAALAELGFEMPRTRDEFKALVQAQLAMGDAGAQTAAALLGVAGAFAAVTPVAEAAAAAIETERRARDDAARASEQAAEQAAAEAARRAEEVARERAGLQRNLLTELGDTNALRRLELDALDASNRALQERIYALQDAKAAEEAAKGAINTAYSALERAVSAEKDAINRQLQAQQDGYQAQIDAAQEAANTIKSIASALASAVKSTQIDSDAFSFQRLQNARSTIGGAASTGNLQYAGLEDALGIAGQDSKKFYGRFEDYAFDQGVLAGNVGKLNDQAQVQLTTAEQMLQALKDQMRASSESGRAQLSALDAQLLEQKNLVDAALGIDNTVLTVEQAVQSVADAIRELAAAQAASAIAKAQGSSAGGGGGAGGMGGGTRYEGPTYTDFMGNQVALQAGHSRQFLAAVAASGTAAVGSLAELRDRLQAVGKSDVWEALSKDLTLNYQDFDQTGGRGLPTISASDGVIDVAGYRSDNQSVQDYAANIRAWAQRNGVQGITNNGYSQSDISNAINTTLGQGASVADILNAGAANFGLTEQEIREAARAAGIPGFASGGYHAGGLRIVGENGPELEATGASRIWNAADTQRMMSGGNGDMVAELRALRAEVAELKSTNAAIAGHTAATHRQLVRIAPNDIVQTEVAA